MLPPARVVELVLITGSGDVLGRLPPFPVETPWWPEAAPVVREARNRHGIEVVVLRLLHAEREVPTGGLVTYLAEVRADAHLPELDPAPALTLGDDERRMPWARPGGPAADLAWAARALERHGLALVGDPEQIRTWNLSSLWRLPVQDGHAWLKHVPPFFAHESAVIARIGAAFVPELIAADGPRVLMREIRGQDMYEAGLDTLSRGVVELVALQSDWVGRADELLALGLPDWRAAGLTKLIESVVERTSAELSAADRRTLDAFVAGLPARFEAVAACGIRDSLVHGDFGPGNLRGDADSLVLLDWGDSGVGHPLLDQAAMIDRAPADAREPLLELWARGWLAARPRSDPWTAARLLEPVAAARQAVIYRMFLDHIEPSEHPYHRADPATWLARAAALARGESQALKAGGQVRPAGAPARRRRPPRA